MVKYIKNRVRSYLSGIAKQCVEDALSGDKLGQVADELATRFTAVDIAGCVSPEDIAQHVDLDDIKDYCAEAMDAVDYEELARWFEVSDIASEIDISDIASEIAIHSQELADNLDYRRLAMADNLDYRRLAMADNLDYRRLAMELLKCVKGGA
jgi:hypothetical protein